MVGRKTAPASKARDEKEEEQFSEARITKVFFVVLTLSISLVAAYIQITKNISESFRKSPSAIGDGRSIRELREETGTTLVVADNMDAGYLDHVVEALLNYGHKLSFSTSITPHKAAQLSHYHLIWTHDYPFQSIKQLNPLQRINHFPGTGFITSKMTLSTTPKLPHMLKAFRLPADKERFLSHAKQHPDKLWIQKSDSHRGISLKTIEKVDFEVKDSLLQEYMSNPLLVDGKKFDIGIYAVLTSVQPLRVYIYESESLLRFCANTYLEKHSNKFNGSDMDSYVVGDDYTPIWLMPSLLRYYIGANLSMKQTLNTYLKKLGKDGDKIWRQIEDTIKSVYKMKEHHLARMASMYQEANNYNATSVEGSLGQFFEMVRFDFIVDENLNVFLMEANMSPNLSSRHFPPNRLIYEQVLNSYFSLVGLTPYARQNIANLPVQYSDGQYKTPHDEKSSATARYGLDGIISEKDLSVYEELCVSDECHMNCDKTDCKICYFCLSKVDKLNLRRAIFEQNSRWNFKRLLPSTFDDDLQMQLTHPDTRKQEINANFIHVNWFRGKCFSDKRFCSY